MSAAARTRTTSRIAAVCLVLLLTLGLLAMVGCASKPVAPSEADKRATCAENQAHIRQAMDLFYADSQMYPPIATVVQKLHAVCPDGGAYTFDEKTQTVSCTVHGHL